MEVREATEGTEGMAAVTEVMVVTEDMVEETGATAVERGAMVAVVVVVTEAAVDIRLVVVEEEATGEAGWCPTLLILHD